MIRKNNLPDTNDKSLKRAAKKGLKVMRKTRAKHPIREEGRIIKYGTKSFARNIWLSAASTMVMTVTLVIAFVTLAASVILTNTAELMRDKIDATIYIKPNTSQEVIDQLVATLYTDKNVRDVEASNSQEESEKTLDKYSENDEILNLIGEDAAKQKLISRMPVLLKIKVNDVNDFSSVQELISTDELFKEYLHETRGPSWKKNDVKIERIATWAEIARTGGIVLAAVFLVISILVIFSTIRMAIFSRREEIYMMKLVGADKRFIRGPFLIEAELCGIIAGLLAATISYFGFNFLAPKLAEYGIDVSDITNVLESNRLILVYVAFVALGVLIGRLSARLAIQKYLIKA